MKRSSAHRGDLTTIILAEDHETIRHGLKLLLETQPTWAVVAEAANGIEALQAMRQHQPDILVLDLLMPVLNGLEVLRHLSKSELRTRSVILSMHTGESYVHQALQHGALAYVLKQSTYDHLLQAIREVLAGRRYLSPPLTAKAIEVYARKAFHDNSTNQSRQPPLTLRESEVLGLVGEGHTNAEIARKLGISPRTVEHFRAKLMRKLNCHNQAHLIRHALAMGSI